MSALHLTAHAAERWRERVGTRPHLDGIRLPFRHVVGRWPRLGGGGRQRVRHIFTPSALLVCRGNAVVTVCAATVDDLATVLVWTLTRTWLG